MILTICAAAAIGALSAVSPVSLIAILLGGTVIVRLARELPAAERPWFAAIVAVALIARIALVGVVFVRNLPYHDDTFVGATTGDEAYAMARALRTRHIVTGLPTSAYDYVVAFDEYGRNSYITALTALQTLFGRAPYGIRLLNIALFTTASLLLFHICRAAFGPVPAFGGLLLLMFWPTLFVWSVSLLKESLYFFAAAIAVSAAIAVVRRYRWRDRALAVGAIVAAAWLMSNLRTGAGILVGGGLLLGAAVATAAASWKSLVASAAAVLVFAGLMLGASARARGRAISGLESFAKTHTGHVFTVGHAYKTLDAAFYAVPQTPANSTLTLMPDQAARFVSRSAASFVLMPLPWQLQSTRELTYLPEQLAWYALVVFLPVGVIFAAHVDRVTTWMLVGSVVPLAATLALTNGNVGTLLRLRGLVIPFLGWISIIGFCAVLGTVGKKNSVRRVNLFDAAVVAAALLLLPAAYGTYLLFRTPPTRISSVTRVPVTREERRVAGTRLTAKLKVRGSALRPMLRAFIDDTPALGFVFEDPNSADVLVGDIPPGTHDLVLYDGVQEVARLGKAVTLESTAAPRIAAVGTLHGLDAADAGALKVGQTLASSGGPQLLKLGPALTDAAGRHQIAELLIQCDPDPNAEGCAVGGLGVAGAAAVRVLGPNERLLSFSLSEVFPAAAATPATMKVRFEVPEELASMMRSGDRDDTIDDRAAVVVQATGRRNADRAIVDAVLRLGLDKRSDGWSYRGRIVKTGAPFRFATEQYFVNGVVLSIDAGAVAQ